MPRINWSGPALAHIPSAPPGMSLIQWAAQQRADGRHQQDIADEIGCGCTTLRAAISKHHSEAAHGRPDFVAVCRHLDIPSWAPQQLARKWAAGEKARRHKRADRRDDLTHDSFDHTVAIASEALDIINYYADARRKGEADDGSALHQSALLAREILLLCGAGAATGAATLAAERTTGQPAAVP